MRTTHATGRLALIALVAGLALTGCSAQDDQEPAPEGVAETGTPEAEGPDGDDADDEDVEEADGDADRVGEIVSFSVPGGWQAETEMMETSESLPFIDEALLYSDPESDAATPRNVTIMVNASSEVTLADPDDPAVFLETLTSGAEAEGQDTTFDALPAVEIDGEESVGYESEVDYGQGLVRQHAYGRMLDSGQFVMIVFSDVPEEFDEHLDEFAAILASIETR